MGLGAKGHQNFWRECQPQYGFGPETTQAQVLAQLSLYLGEWAHACECEPLLLVAQIEPFRMTPIGEWTRRDVNDQFRSFFKNFIDL